MKTHAAKLKNEKNRSFANPAVQKRGGQESTFQFVDNRAEVIGREQLQHLASNSPQVQQTVQLQALANDHALGWFAQQPGTIQRYVDLDAKYANSNKVDDEDKQEWLPKFRRIQVLLNDTETVRAHLAALAGYMGKHQVTLHQALAAHEAGTWTDARPILLGFVPPPVFEDFVRRGQLFVDLVGKTHGVQTHRIQWYIIKAEFGAEFAKATYAEAVHPRWKAGKNMWDWIVDDVSEVAGEFTTPNRLEDYLLQEFESLCSRSDLGRLRTQVSQGHESQRDDRSAILEKSPPEKNYTRSMKAAMAEHKRLSEEDKYAQQGLDIVGRIQFERVKYRDGGLLARSGEAYTFTGWIYTRSSGTYFTPTVAYPEGADPGETVPSY